MGRIWDNLKRVGKTSGRIIKALVDSAAIGLGHPVINLTLSRYGGKIGKIIAGATAIAKEIYRWKGYDVDWGTPGVTPSYLYEERVRREEANREATIARNRERRLAEEAARAAPPPNPA